MLDRLIKAAPLALLLALAPTAACQPTEAAHEHATQQAAAGTVPLYDNLGDHAYAISTRVPAAQRYFNQGMRLYYAFNHAEAVRAFDEAARLDPDCAMCYWGKALALGPNINAPMDSAAAVRAYAAVREALAREGHATPKERALIDALARRYAADAPAERAGLDSAYSLAMAEVVKDYTDDAEAAVLYGESLMDLRPWNYWTDDGELQPGMAEALSHFQRVIAVNPNHPGACHFYIHAVEEVHPERAIPCAERLAGLMPGAGHLVHMPGHIYIRVGRYLDAIKANEHAVHADETYIRDQRPGTGLYTAGYYPHNYDFLAFAASMVGRSQQAIDAAERVAALVPKEMLRAPGLTFLQQFITRPLQMRVRFSRWEEILETPAPAEDLPHARALWHYARGRAFAARGDVDAAEAELAQVRAAIEDPTMQAASLEFNSVTAVLKIAEGVLAGYVAAARGEDEAAIARLRDAVRAEDALKYGEPPEWSVPVRQELGALLVELDRPAEAEVVFRQDLRRFPDNGWSLFGLSQSLAAQGRAEAADEVGRRFAEVWKGADVELDAPRP